MTPDRLEHPRLGVLRWDDEHHWFAGRHRDCRVNLDPFTNFVPSQRPHELPDAEAFVDGCAERIEAVLDAYPVLAAHVAGDLLALYNEDWQDGEPIDPGEFVLRLSLDAITVDADFRCEVFLDDGDLFAGHAIIVDVDADGSLGRVQLFG